MKLIKINKNLLLVGLACLYLSGCSGPNGDLKKYIAEVNARKTTQIPPIPQIKQYESFEYVPQDRKDPFILKEARALNSDTPQPDLNRNKEPLESFPLDSLKMVGRVIYHKVQYAMIKAPDAVIYRVKVGNYMGQNYGKVVEIQDKLVNLNETVADNSGNFISRDASVAMEDAKSK